MEIKWSKSYNCWIANCEGCKETRQIPNWTPDETKFEKYTTKEIWDKMKSHTKTEKKYRFKGSNMLSKEQIEALIREKKHLLDKSLQREQDYIDSIVEDTKTLGAIRDNISEANDLIDDLETMLKECEP